MTSSPNALTNQRGIGFLALMCAIVLIGITASLVGQQWTVLVKRDREAELLFRGSRIKNAIESYAADYEVRKGTRANRYPVRLEQLVEGPKRYMQEVYKDPMTGLEFEVIKVGAEIRGVKSRSKEKPLNTVQFKDAKSYNQVRFEAQAHQGQGVPGANPINPINPLNPLNQLGAVPERPVAGTSAGPSPIGTP